MLDAALSKLTELGCASAADARAHDLTLLDGCLVASADNVAAPVDWVHRGTDNVIVYGRDSALPEQIRVYGKGNILFIGDGCDLTRSAINISANQGVVIIGRGTRIEDSATVRLENGGMIRTGERCWIGRLCIVSNSDGHAIYNRATGIRKNPDRDVTIGDGVLVEANCRIAKGAFVGAGAVVAEQSMVNGDIPAHSLACGIPARPVERDIGWSWDDMCDVRARTKVCGPS